MSLTALDPQTAMIVVDVQQGIIGSQFIHTGMALGASVESTAHQAYEQGFNVTLAIDAMTDLRPEAHACSLKHVFPRPGETRTTRPLDLLAKRST